MPDDGDLLDLLAEFAPDEATRNRILVDNPAASTRSADQEAARSPLIGRENSPWRKLEPVE